MRYGTCLACAFLAAEDPQLLAAATVTEDLSGDCHHHHTRECDTCDAWWFDDYVTGGLGTVVPARRDTVLCGCPDDDQHLYTRCVVMVPLPESGCHCTAADAARAIAIRLRAGEPPGSQM